jgi:hypothetical protein
MSKDTHSINSSFRGFAASREPLLLENRNCLTRRREGEKMMKGKSHFIPFSFRGFAASRLRGFA